MCACWGAEIVSKENWAILKIFRKIRGSKGVKKIRLDTMWTESRRWCIKQRWQENHFVANVKGCAKAGFIYRRERIRSKSSFCCSRDERISKNTRGHWCSFEIELNAVPKSLFAERDPWLSLLVNGFFQSLWSRQQCCKMAATRDIYMETLNGSNSTCNCDECYVWGCCWCGTICISRLESSDADLFFSFRDPSVVFVSESRIDQCSS